MHHAPALLLFDVDGTLTYSAGLTRVAFELAISELFRIPNSTRGIEPYGRTDRWIFREILKNNSIPTGDFEAQFERFSRVTSRYLESELRASNKIKLHPGISELLNTLAGMNYIYLALGTGNIRENAYLKLKPHGVEHYFPVGGFGSDDEDRGEILRIACRRAEQHYGVAFEPQRIWVIGDTPLDIIHGREIDAKTIAVATGTYSFDELVVYKPDAVFVDFTEKKRFINLISGNHTGSDTFH